jgi:hypothetical protein
MPTPPPAPPSPAADQEAALRLGSWYHSSQDLRCGLHVQEARNGPAALAEWQGAAAAAVPASAPEG